MRRAGRAGCGRCYFTRVSEKVHDAAMLLERWN